MRRIKIGRNLVLHNRVCKCRIKRRGKYFEWTAPYQGDKAYTLACDGTHTPRPALLKWLANVEAAINQKRWDALEATHIRIATTVPSIRRMCDLYEIAATKRRTVAGTPTERSAGLVLQRFRAIARDCKLRETEPITAMTPDVIDGWILRRVTDQTTATRPREKALAVAAQILTGARGIFARWALEEYRRQGADIPESVLHWPRPATAWKPQWQDPPRELKLATLAAAEKLKKEQPKIWILFHVLLSFGCRPNDALTMRISDFRMMPGSDGQPRRFLIYTPHKTRDRNGKQVIMPVPDRVWDEMTAARRKAGCAEDDLLVPSVPGCRGRQQVQFDLNAWLRGVGWTRPNFYQAAYNLRKLFTSAVLVAAGEQAASDYCGSSIAMVRRHYGAFYTERLPEIDAAAVMRG